MSADVGVVGGGPAGAVAARALAALGHRVVVVAAPRRLAAVEGVSERTVDALRRAGCDEALAGLGPLLPRFSTWGGASAASGADHLAERHRLDAALRHDAERAAVRFVDGRCETWEERDDEYRLGVRCSDGERLTLATAFVVDARGRAASLDRESGARGPATTALFRLWRRGPRAAQGSALTSFDDGWCWTAAPEAGPTYVQIVVASEPGAIGSRRKLAAAYESLLARIPEARERLDGASPGSGVGARDATPTLGGRLITARSLRVGDAALAPDPLSGQGLFEAVATALAAAPVVNTLLRSAASRGLAEEFYRPRIEDTFLRLVRTGRDLYRSERRWSDRPFWRERSAWPDDQPARGLAAGAAELRAVPVSENGLIVARRAVVTADHPRGIWRLDGVELAPLADCAAARRGEPGAAVVADYAARFDVDRSAAERALAWLRHRGLG